MKEKPVDGKPTTRLASYTQTTEKRFYKDFHFMPQPLHYDELKGIGKSWLQHHEKFLPRFCYIS